MISVIRLLDHRGTFFPRTYALGVVEIRNPNADTIPEREALMASCLGFGDARPDDCMRIVTLVDSASHYEADQVAEERFQEALDALSSETFGLSRLELLSTGAFVLLSRWAVTPRTAELPVTLGGTPVFRIMREPFPQIEYPQLLLGRGDDLSQRLLRSYHWSRKAHLEANPQLRILFRWFAMEAVWMMAKDDDIVPRIMWSLGFPTGQKAKELSVEFVRRLGDHPTYCAWRSQIERQARRVTKMRNDSVHSGFRPQDISAGLLREFDHLTVVACSRVQSLARTAIVAGLRSVSEMFEHLPMLAEGDDNYVNDVHGTIIYGLEHPVPSSWH